MGSQEKLPNSNSDMQLVTVYRLNEDGKWDDQGTGHITVNYMERSENPGLIVIDEEDNETLLLHRICSDDIYRKQDDTIISWRDPDSAIELALSFQDKAGCTYIWDHVCSLQRSMHFSSLTNETFHSMNSELRELPPVELSTLPLILKTIVESGIADQLRVTDLILQDQDFFRKLVKLFRICEDLENIDGLHLIFKIIRGIISLNSSPLFEKIFGDDFIMDIIGCLEYNPQGPRVHHRDFLKDRVVFKEVIPITNPVIISKIHQTYRVGYLKDVILPKALDEAVMAYLNSIVLSNNAFVVSLLKDDSAFVKELFSRLKSSATSIDSKKTLVYFLHEFFILSKSLQMVHQIQLLRDFVNEGLFDVVTEILQSEDRKLALTGAEIIMQSVTLDPNILRPYVDRQPDGILLGLLVRNMLADYGENMHCQFYEIVRNLLDANVSGSQNGTTIEVFYEKHLSQLINAITSSCSPCGPSLDGSNTTSSDGGSQISTIKPEILLNISDLLCFCVLQHPYRIKCNFLLNNVVEKVLLLTRRKEKYLVVAAVRFFRTLLARSDEHLMNHLVKNNLFKPIIDVFVANGDRYNLLNSAVLDLFEHIRKENLKILIRHLVDAFWNQLVRFESLPPIHDLQVKYEQSLESGGTRSSGELLDQRKRADQRALEKEEEDYFNGDSDEEDSASTQTATTNRGQDHPPIISNSRSSSPQTSTRSGGLVDYDDDEDDEDYRPPPPPKKNIDAPNDDGELVKGFPLKRKLVSKDEPDPKRLPNGVKPKRREGVFAALRHTLSEVVLPDKKKSAAPNSPQPDANDDPAKTDVDENGPKSSCNAGQDAKTDEQSGELNESANNMEEGTEHPLLPSNSSPEMTVNGSCS